MYTWQLASWQWLESGCVVCLNVVLSLVGWINKWCNWGFCSYSFKNNKQITTNCKQSHFLLSIFAYNNILISTLIYCTLTWVARHVTQAYVGKFATEKKRNRTTLTPRDCTHLLSFQSKSTNERPFGYLVKLKENKRVKTEKFTSKTILWNGFTRESVLCYFIKAMVRTTHLSERGGVFTLKCRKCRWPTVVLWCCDLH